MALFNSWCIIVTIVLLFAFVLCQRIIIPYIDYSRRSKSTKWTKTNKQDKQTSKQTEQGKGHIIFRINIHRSENRLEVRRCHQDLSRKQNRSIQPKVKDKLNQSQRDQRDCKRTDSTSFCISYIYMLDCSTDTVFFNEKIAHYELWCIPI